MNTLDIIQKLGEKEDALIGSSFVSPVFNNTNVITLVSGLVYSLKIPRVSPGWYCVKAISNTEAEIVEEADLMQIEEYLKKFPKIRIILIQKQGNYHIGIPFKNNNQDFNFRNPLPIFLTDDNVDLFETVICRFDGGNLWFNNIDPSSDLIKSEHLRDAFEKGIEPSKICYKGLSIEEKVAYSLRFNLDKNHRELLKHKNLKKDIEFAGGRLIKFDERKDHYSVTYKVDNQEYTSYISKDPVHQVLTAGICLEEGDKNFDLTSLISVIREGQRRNLIYRFHNTR